MSACETDNSPEKPQRHVCAPALLHKGKHQSTTGWPPIAVARVCEPCTESQDRTACLDRLRVTMGSRVWVCTACRGSGIRGWRSGETSRVSSCMYFCSLQGKTGSPSKFGSRSSWKRWILTKRRRSSRSRWPPTASSKASRLTSRASPGVSVRADVFVQALISVDADVCAKWRSWFAVSVEYWNLVAESENHRSVGYWVLHWLTSFNQPVHAGLQRVFQLEEKGAIVHNISLKTFRFLHCAKLYRIFLCRVKLTYIILL